MCACVRVSCVFVVIAEGEMHAASVRLLLIRCCRGQDCGLLVCLIIFAAAEGKACCLYIWVFYLREMRVDCVFFVAIAEGNAPC